MNKLIQDKTDSFPYVELNKEHKKFLIEGILIPEEVNKFSDPIMQWLNEYFKAPLAETDFHFKMEYFNTASAKALLKIMNKLDELSDSGKKVNIYWHHNADDTDVQESGEEYQQLVKTPIQLVPFTDENTPQ